MSTLNNATTLKWMGCHLTKAVTMAMLLVSSPLSHANGDKCYRLVPRSGGQFAMCLELEKNLNEFCGEPPMVCALKISPKYPKLTLPKWTDLDVEQNMDLIERLVRGSMLHAEKYSPGSSDRNWAMIRDRIVKYAREDNASLSRARIDLANRGVRELIYRVDSGFCADLNFGTAMNDPEWMEIIEKRKPNERFIKTDPMVFSERHAQILDNPEWRARAEEAADPFPGASALTYVTDMFFYEGRAFKFNWELGPWVQEVSTVRPKSLEGTEIVGQSTVCQFKYSETEK